MKIRQLSYWLIVVGVLAALLLSIRAEDNWSKLFDGSLLSLGGWWQLLMNQRNDPLHITSLFLLIVLCYL